MSHASPAAILILSMATCLFADPAFAGPDAHGNSQSVSSPVSTGNCKEKFTAYSVSIDLQKTASTAFKDVAGTTLSFTQGQQGCVEVSFTAEAATTRHELLVVRAMLDDKVCIPGGNIFASDSPSSDFADHGMNYICGNVSPGAHTVKMQFRSQFGHQVALAYRDTVVRYSK